MVQDLGISALREAVVIISSTVGTANLADDTNALLALVGIGIGAVTVRVLLAVTLARAKAFVLVVLSVGAADRVVKAGALAASVSGVSCLLADTEGLESGALAFKGAQVQVCPVVFTANLHGDKGAVVAALDQVGAFTCAVSVKSDAVERAHVIVSSAVDSANWVVFPLTVALGGAGSQILGNLLTAVQNTLVLKGDTAQRANGGRVGVAVASSGGGGLNEAGRVARTVVSLPDVLDLESAVVSVGYAIDTAHWVVDSGAVGDKLAVWVLYLRARAVVLEVDTGNLQGAKVRVGDVVNTAHLLLAERAETSLGSVEAYDQKGCRYLQNRHYLLFLRHSLNWFFADF